MKSLREIVRVLREENNEMKTFIDTLSIHKIIEIGMDQDLLQQNIEELTPEMKESFIDDFHNIDAN